MASPVPQILRARIVWPVRCPPIEAGAVVIHGQRIAAVGRWAGLRARFPGKVQDLGNVILLPGLVNAHCHLDYTHMAGLFPPQRSFCDWIKLITTEKAGWTYSDFANSWLAGAKMLLRSGTTTVGDVEAVPELLPDVWNATPLRVLSFLEMTGVKSRRDPELILREALARVDSLAHPRCSAALSPHAPYSTPPGLLRRTAAAARRRRFRVTTHVAESATEFEMFTRGHGEMFDWLQRNERNMADCGGVSPVQHLARQRALGPHLLAIHVNHLAAGDSRLLARSRTHVVHCPRSHDYFGHAPFPFTRLQRAGVNVCLGTDSLATVRKHPKRELRLDLFLEMRAFAAKHPEVPPPRILEMVTLNPARALGGLGEIGELTRHAQADLIALSFAGNLAEVEAAVVNHSGDVSASMIGGEWTLAPRG